MAFVVAAIDSNNVAFAGQVRLTRKPGRDVSEISAKLQDELRAVSRRCEE